MMGTLLSRVIWYFCGLINAAGEFQMGFGAIFSVGGEENRCLEVAMPKAYITVTLGLGHVNWTKFYGRLSWGSLRVLIGTGP